MEAQIKRGMRIAAVIKKILQSDEGGDIRPGENVLDATGEVRSKGEKNGQAIVFSGSFLFKEGSAELRIGALPVLDGIAKVMLDGDEKISVEGHTDDREKPVNSRISTGGICRQPGR